MAFRKLGISGNVKHCRTVEEGEAEKNLDGLCWKLVITRVRAFFISYLEPSKLQLVKD